MCFLGRTLMALRVKAGAQRGRVRASPTKSSTADGAAAIDACERGNTAAGIPVLEKRLTDQRFTLPKRS